MLHLICIAELKHPPVKKLQCVCISAHTVVAAQDS